LVAYIKRDVFVVDGPGASAYPALSFDGHPETGIVGIDTNETLSNDAFYETE
jgi:hypothetical protein